MNIYDDESKPTSVFYHSEKLILSTPQQVLCPNITPAQTALNTTARVSCRLFDLVDFLRLWIQESVCASSPADLSLV